MNKLILLSIIFTLTFCSSLNAKSTFEGQKIYLKECRTCHLGSGIFLNTHTYKEWEKVLDDDGVILSNIHLSKSEKNVRSKDGILKSSHSYFKSVLYNKQYKELKNFIISSAQKNEKSFEINKKIASN